MHADTKRMDDFLTKYNMHPTAIDLPTCTKNFLSEMEKGLTGQATPVMMLPTYLSTDGTLPLGQPVIVVDAGGTNFRTGLVTMTEAGPVIESVSVCPMPGSQGAITKGAFLDQVSDILLPLTAKSKRVGFSFSYAAVIQPDGDALVLPMSKQVKIIGSEGMHLGAELSQALASKGAEGVQFIVLNDTVAALLGGLAGLGQERFDGYVGFIYGTGVNSCYPQATPAITKLTTPWTASNMVINMESGGFSLVPQGEFDRRLDQKSSDPGYCLYEKMVSGRYEGSLIWEGLHQASVDGLLSPQLTLSLEKWGDLSLVEADAFTARPYGDNPLAQACVTESDRVLVYTLIDRSMERAARLICCNIAAVLEQADMGKSMHLPACIVVEGSTFHKGYLFQDKLKRLCHQYITQELGRYLVFRKVEDANLLGTAAAALLMGDAGV